MGCLATVAWILAFDNFAFWKTIASAQGGMSWEAGGAMAGLALVLLFMFSAVLRPLAGGRLGCLMLGAVLLASASISHYVDAWGLLFDKGLVRNMVETDAREVRELLSWPALIDLFWRGLFPAALLHFVGVRRSTASRAIRQTIMLTSVGLATAAAVAMIFYGTLASTFRNHRELRFQLVPSNFINATYGYLKADRTSTAPLIPVALDATRKVGANAKPLVLVFIVGETARAANFSLGGYARDTNVALADSNAVYFSGVVACGTDTATSLPCMFSDLGVAGFTNAKAQSRENALDVLQRTGVSVEWIDNNSGCKGVCSRVPNRQLPTIDDGIFCDGTACLDGVLVDALRASLAEVKGDSAIVLHQMGSHGPSYFKRYPAPGPFQPTCDTNRIQACDVSTLVNTYDNSIDYTSQTIAQAISVANAQAANMDVAVIYLSDHGESLGERNIYLHGLPTLLAPKEQTRVPMIVWMSEGVQRRLRTPKSCLTSISGQPLSHDNVFSTLLGFFSINTKAYQPSLDVWSVARSSSNCTDTERLTLK
ncbi:hypothetical protein AX767_09600 [Variovorax sp. PAMC 28711]|nr:hypothetical protein AX767_09600 [Variovorax sp. PAMC 28711]